MAVFQHIYPLHHRPLSLLVPLHLTILLWNASCWFVSFRRFFKNDSVVDIQRIFYEFSLDFNFFSLFCTICIRFLWLGSVRGFFFQTSCFISGHIIFSILLLLLAQQCIRYIAAFFLVYSFSIPLVPDVTIVNIDILLQRLIFHLEFSPQLIEAYNVS